MQKGTAYQRIMKSNTSALKEEFDFYAPKEVSKKISKAVDKIVDGLIEYSQISEIDKAKAAEKIFKWSAQKTEYGKKCAKVMDLIVVFHDFERISRRFCENSLKV